MSTLIFASGARKARLFYTYGILPVYFCMENKPGKPPQKEREPKFAVLSIEEAQEDFVYFIKDQLSRAIIRVNPLISKAKVTEDRRSRWENIINSLDLTINIIQIDECKFMLEAVVTIHEPFPTNEELVDKARYTPFRMHTTYKKMYTLQAPLTKTTDM